VLWWTLYQAEGALKGSWLRRKALAECMRHVHYEARPPAAACLAGCMIGSGSPPQRAGNIMSSKPDLGSTPATQPHTPNRLEGVSEKGRLGWCVAAAAHVTLPQCRPRCMSGGVRSCLAF